MKNAQVIKNKLDKKICQRVLFNFFPKTLLWLCILNSPFILAKETSDQNTNLIEVFVHFNLTTHIYFDSKIKYIDIGDGDTLIWKSVDNLIKISRSTNENEELKTNMTVHTLNGIYGFMVSTTKNENFHPYYFIKLNQALKTFHQKHLVENPIIHENNLSSDSLTYFSTQKNKIHNQNTPVDRHKLPNIRTPIVKEHEEKTKQDALNLLDDICLKVAQKNAIFSNIGATSENLIVYLSGVYIFKDNFFLKITFKNRSRINFNISYYSFTIVPRKKKKNQIMQETYLKPIKEYPAELLDIEAKTNKKDKIYVFEKFVITKQKVLNVYIGEQNGRILNFTIPSSFLVNAKKI